MIETVELRNKPELKIILNAGGFEIVDVSEPKNSGIYSFGQIKNVELNKRRTDWFISILSWIVDIFFGSAVGGNFKNRANLQLEMEDNTLKIWLPSADFKKAERVAELINNKKSFTQ